jgi:predicted CxxxxCH...CXXCH cytochrome family protein
MDCNMCHPHTVDDRLAILVEVGHHINGVVEIQEDCSACHGDDRNAAPPLSTDGGSETTAITVGAHQSHVTDGYIRKALYCGECHVVPASVGDPGHIDASPAEVTWGVLALTGSVTPNWDRTAATCSDTYCHGATLGGGTNKTPHWTTVDGSQASCGTCHGAPPPAPHTSSTDCRGCHPGTMDATGNIDVEGGLHINGVVDVGMAMDCNSCHGSANNAAPPVSTTGSSDTADTEVGAHQSHLADGTLRRAVACEECHVVPAAVGDPGHIDTAPAEVTFGALATHDGATPMWERSTDTCSNTYCHGATLGGGTNKTPIWTTVGGGQSACGTCHGVPPPAPHPAGVNCVDCHPDTVDANFNINIDNHIDGVLQVTVSGACDGCHGAPPATGAHLAHYGATPADASYGGTSITVDLLPAGTAYAFDCGNCHPTDPAHHMNGVNNPGGGRAEIDLSPSSAHPGSLKARNPQSASYTPGGALLTDAQGYGYTLGTCSDVYCHSYMEFGTPGSVPVPGVDFPFTGYPMTYPAHTVDSTRTYQSPVWSDTLSCDGCHGFPPRTFYPAVTAGAGDSHSFIGEFGYDNLHGWNMSGDPVACATCHFDTVTDQGVRTRDYNPPADGWAVYQPVPIADHVFHVNGQPDIGFTTDPAPVIYAPGFDLTGATYDPQTRTCSNVPCHVNQTQVEWGSPYRWMNSYECNVCHQM